MAYLCDFSDGASDYLAADVLNVWTSGSITSLIASDVDGTALNNPVTLKRSLSNSSDGRIAGFRYNASSLPIGIVQILSYFNGSQLMGALRINASGQLQVIDGNLNVLAADTAAPLSASTFYTIEFGYLVSDSVGQIEVKVNGTQVAALTSTSLGGTASSAFDTKPASQTTIDTIEITGGVACVVDWIWTKYDTGIWASGDWIGAARKITLRPKTGTAGDGFYNTGTAWSVGAGSTTISDVLRDASGMDSDTSFAVRAAISGTDTDRYGVKHDAMPSNTNVVKLVSHRAYVRNTAGSASTHKRFVYAAAGATTHDSAITVTDNTVYAGGTSGGTTTQGNHQQDNFLTHPNGSAWTKTLVDNLELGIKAVTLA